MSRHLERGHTLLELGRAREAATEFAKEAALPGEEQAHALALLALTELDGGSAQLAADHLARAKDLNPMLAVVRWAGAVLAAREGDVTRMRRELLALRISDPSDPVRLGLCALLHHEVDDFESALSAAIEGLALDPDNDDCLNAAAAACANLGKRSQSEGFADRLLQVNPLLAQGHSHLARRALAKGDLPAATEHARDALRIDPHELNAHVVLLRARAMTHWFYLLLNGRISGWIMPVWLRIAAPFLPLLVMIAVYVALDYEPPPWLDRMTGPTALIPAWIAGFFGWITWYFAACALRDRDVRRALLRNQRDLLIPGIPATIVLVSVVFHVITGFNVAGVVFTAGILGFSLLAIFSQNPGSMRPRLYLPFIGLFLLSVAGQIADHHGVTWAATALFGLILALAAALPILLLILRDKIPTAQPPPLPPTAHEPPPLPR